MRFVMELDDQPIMEVLPEDEVAANRAWEEQERVQGAVNGQRGRRPRQSLPHVSRLSRRRRHAGNSLPAVVTSDGRGTQAGMTQPVDTGVSDMDLAVQNSIDALTLDDNGVEADFDSAMVNGVLEENRTDIELPVQNVVGGVVNDVVECLVENAVESKRVRINEGLIDQEVQTTMTSKYRELNRSSIVEEHVNVNVVDQETPRIISDVEGQVVNQNVVNVSNELLLFVGDQLSLANPKIQRVVKKIRAKATDTNPFSLGSIGKRAFSSKTRPSVNGWKEIVEFLIEKQVLVCVDDEPGSQSRRTQQKNTGSFNKS